MAVLLAERIARNYRRDQGKVAAATVADVLALWPLLDPFRLADTVDDWLRQVLGTVATRRAESISVAQKYYLDLRERAAPRSAGRLPPPAPEDPQWSQAAAVSVLAIGPSRIKTLSGNGIPPPLAAEKAAPEVAAAAARHVSNAGRSHVERTGRADPVAVGWRRQTSAKPCFWCAMLASRLVLYDSPETALGVSPDAYHSGCVCVAVPVFRHRTALPDQSQAYAELWQKSTRGTSGKASLRAFRRAYYAQQRDQAAADQ